MSRPSLIDLTVPKVPTRPLCTLHDMAVGRCTICQETRKRFEAQPVATCAWTESGDGPWESACGKTWEFIEGGPIENGMAFCLKCGKPLEVPHAS